MADTSRVLISPHSASGKKAFSSGNNYLFVVGIDDYKHHNALNNAVSDAKSLKKLLTEQYDFQTENVVELFNADATNKNIMRQLRSYERLTSEDNLLFFYSGHGFYRGGLGYIVPVDAEDEEDFILNSSLRDRLSLIKAKHIALIFDACFSGSFVLAKDVLGERLAHKPSRWALAAGNIELVSDGIAGRNSPFASAMLDVLKDFEDDEIGIQRLFIETRDKTILRGAIQTPIGGSIKMEGNEGGEFVFHRRNLEAETWLALSKTNKTALKSFIEKYPNGTHTAEAKALLGTIETQEAAQNQADEAHRKQEAEKQAFHYAKNSSDKRVALEKFILNYPLSIFQKEAQDLLEEAEEDAAWKEAKSKNALTAFLKFRGNYPNGKYNEECQKRIEAFNKPEPTPAPPMPPPVVVVVPDMTPVAPVVEKPKPEPVVTPVPKSEPIAVVEPLQIIDNQPTVRRRGDVSFFQKYKMPILGGALLVLVLVVWTVLRPKNEIKNNNTPVVVDTTKNETPITDVKPHNENPLKVEPIPKPVLPTPSVSIPFKKPDMISVSGGTFQMGSNVYDDEKPIHPVTINSYSIGKYEVTFEEYDAFCAATKRTKAKDEGWGRGKRPVINVSWDDATAYCKWLKDQTGESYRLPTEAEWEYAARGGNKSNGNKYSGSNTLNDVAWNTTNSSSKTHTVGGLKPNELGIYDMSGNVWEWCSDWYDKDYYKNSPSQNPKGPSSTGSRVLRGGSWLSDVNYCRVAGRDDDEPANRFNAYGFRVVRND
jgi:formylglycine-generating enzyme